MTTVKTTKGRVVYDRKHHGFEAKDVVRIFKTLDLADYTGDPGSFAGLVEIYFQAWGLIVQGILMMLTCYPEYSGSLVLKIIREFRQALGQFILAAPGITKLVIVSAFARLLATLKEE
ncbi:hypothetical protein ES705_42865 [subsurface metagenome]